jgi:hypothetical protein
MKAMQSIVALLIIATGSLVQTAAAGMIQDQKPGGDYANRDAPPISAEARKEMEARLEEARRLYEAKPNDPETIIWLHPHQHLAV